MKAGTVAQWSACLCSRPTCLHAHKWKIPSSKVVHPMTHTDRGCSSLCPQRKSVHGLLFHNPPQVTSCCLKRVYSLDPDKAVSTTRFHFMGKRRRHMAVSPPEPRSLELCAFQHRLSLKSPEKFSGGLKAFKVTQVSERFQILFGQNEEAEEDCGGGYSPGMRHPHRHRLPGTENL